MSSEPSVPLSEPDLSGNEAAYLAECVTSGYVSSVGPFVDRFEAAVASITGVSTVVGVSSGTAALHLAGVVAGIGPGDEVWIPSCTFIATANAFARLQAELTFVDSAPDRLEADPDLLLEELRARRRHGRLPKAIVPVHVYGEPSQMEWLDEARDAGVVVIEDAAESLGSRWTDGPWAGAHTGTAGELGCFSFNGNKIFTAGGGGAVVGDPALLARIRHLATQARIPGTDYLHDEIGFNERLTNLCAAVGLAQLERAAPLLTARRRIHERYVDALEGAPDLECLRWSAGANCWLSVVVASSVGRARELAEALRAAGIQTRAVWPALHRQLPYGSARRIGSGHRAEDWSARSLCLPSSATLTDDDHARVLEAIVRAG